MGVVLLQKLIVGGIGDDGRVWVHVGQRQKVFACRI